uniref:AlNc14C76G5110 protein n=1 Tax=Albugo laibachii Nc14 TaxID=890382 RepID=F0WER0_9STRA|nr:AlNc14C76G5110 [Albugo laibachii Nc14]|eukprot:CCA19692.1 AlNc14C76G5110 [Albugo laibachii Nc14]
MSTAGLPVCEHLRRVSENIIHWKINIAWIYSESKWRKDDWDYYRPSTTSGIKLSMTPYERLCRPRESSCQRGFFNSALLHALNSWFELENCVSKLYPESNSPSESVESKKGNYQQN